MRCFQWLQWRGLSQRSVETHTPEYERRARASKVRTTPKHDGKIEPVLTALETRELFGSVVADVALVAGGVAVAQRASDPFGESAWVDFSVSGNSTDGERALARSGTGTLDAGVSFGASQNQPRRPSESGSLSSTASGAGSSSHTLNPGASGLNDIDSLPPTIGSTLLASALSDVVPRPDDDFRKLALAPPPGGGAGSSGLVATTNGATPRRDSDIEITSPGDQP